MDLETYLACEKTGLEKTGQVWDSETRSSEPTKTTRIWRLKAGSWMHLDLETYLAREKTGLEKTGQVWDSEAHSSKAKKKTRR